MISLKHNIVANYLGSAWNALMGIVFVPAYIHFLGVEAYGLMAVFGVLQAWLVLLDMGMSPALNRELARADASAHTPESINDLVHSIAAIYAIVAVLLAALLIGGAPFIVSHWLDVRDLPSMEATDALRIFGLLLAFRWIASLYAGAMSGMQRQVWLSTSTAIFATLRAGGAVAVLAYVSSTITAFVAYQAAVVAIEATVLRLRVRRLLPPGARRARFSVRSLQSVWRFAAGLSTITLLSLLLTQLDKVVLSKMLSLTDFGYYALAGTMAGALLMLITPVTSALLPRLVQVVTRGDERALTQAYHDSAQVLAIAVVPAGLVLAFFSHDVLLLWIRDERIASAASPLATVLALSMMFYGLMHTPYMLQLAHGYTRLIIRSNAAMVVLLVPALLTLVREYGALAAAAILLCVNLSYILVVHPIALQRFLAPVLGRWYIADLLIPLAAAGLVCVAARDLAPAPSLNGRLESAAVIASASLGALAAVVLATPLGRRYVRGALASVKLRLIRHAGHND